MNHISDEALCHIINALRPLAQLAPFYSMHEPEYVMHGVGLAQPPYELVITVADVLRAKEIVDAYDARTTPSA